MDDELAQESTIRKIRIVQTEDLLEGNEVIE